MHVADSIFIFLLALILFGPKRLPEIGKQIGKLLAEFRRASNDFKYQIEDELRQMEQQDRQKKIDSETAAAQLAAPATPTADSTEAEITIMPPSVGAQVTAEAPYGVSSTSTETPDASAHHSEDAAVNGTEAHETVVHDLAPAAEHLKVEQEEAQTPTHHG
jgi:sec-independent protein translocase protein TatB